uniref:CSON008182 protein n=1 Tax=Culicoides sonorensis TaxID=179676 RepID=A0A336N1H3_CULSO
MSFKFVIFFAIITLSTKVGSFEIPQLIRESMINLHDKCIEKTGAKLENLRKCKELYIPDDQASKCYLDCMIGNIDIDLEEKLAHIETIKHEINADIHDLVHHVRKECDAKIHFDDKCEESWQRANCHLKAHDDSIEFCLLLMFRD